MMTGVGLTDQIQSNAFVAMPALPKQQGGLLSILTLHMCPSSIGKLKSKVTIGLYKKKV